MVDLFSGDINRLVATYVPSKIMLPGYRYLKPIFFLLSFLFLVYGMLSLIETICYRKMCFGFFFLFLSYMYHMNADYKQILCIIVSPKPQHSQKCYECFALKLSLHIMSMQNR